MKPTLKRGDYVEVQSRIYTRVRDGSMRSAPKGSRGCIIDFCPMENTTQYGHRVEVEMLAMVRLQMGYDSTLDVLINERALLLVPDASRKQTRASRRAANGRR